MKQGRPVLLAALLLPLLAFPNRLPNGSPGLANDQFETAKARFNQQDYYGTLRLLGLVRSNSPSSAAPWLLAGHCFYLQGQDLAALFHYHQAHDLNPLHFPMPKFAAALQGRAAGRGAVSLDIHELYALRRKIGQMIMVSLPGTALTGQKRALLKAGWIGGVILYRQNVVSKVQVSAYIQSLQANSPTPLFVAVDQEGGAVRRFTEQEGFQRLPSLAALGRTGNSSLAYRFGLLSGTQLREVGANLNLAPVVDLDHGVEGSIITKYQRSLGQDPETVTKLAGEIIRGMRDKGVLATAKHFPTQSLTEQNTHERSAVTDRSSSQLEAQDVLPYRRLIGAGVLDAVMLSHVVYRDLDPYFPASLSPEIVQTLLRGKLGYQGLVLSDDLRMDAIKGRFPLESSVVQAVNAGVDILLITDNMEKRVMDALVEAVASGRVPRAAVDAAYKRIMATKEKYGLLAKRVVPAQKPAPAMAPAVVQPGPSAQAPAPLPPATEPQTQTRVLAAPSSRDPVLVVKAPAEDR